MSTDERADERGATTIAATMIAEGQVVWAGQLALPDGTMLALVKRLTCVLAHVDQRSIAYHAQRSSVRPPRPLPHLHVGQHSTLSGMRTSHQMNAAAIAALCSLQPCSSPSPLPLACATCQLSKPGLHLRCAANPGSGGLGSLATESGSLQHINCSFMPAVHS